MIDYLHFSSESAEWNTPRVTEKQENAACFTSQQTNKGTAMTASGDETRNTGIPEKLSDLQTQFDELKEENRALESRVQEIEEILPPDRIDWQQSASANPDEIRIGPRRKWG